MVGASDGTARAEHPGAWATLASLRRSGPAAVRADKCGRAGRRAGRSPESGPRSDSRERIYELLGASDRLKLGERADLRGML